MSRRRALLALVPAALVAACGRDGSTAAVAEKEDARAGTTATFAAGTTATFAAGTRPSAPAVVGELLDGSAFDLASWRGQLVVVNFWGSWCAPCRAEASDLQATYLATRDSGVRFLGVDVRDGRDAAIAFHDAFGIGYPSLFDPPGRISLGFTDVPPNVIPATIVLDRDLRVAAVLRRRVYQRELQDIVRALAAEPSAGAGSPIGPTGGS